MKQFDAIINTTLQIGIPFDVLEQEVFIPSPYVKDDEKGELREISDLGLALKIWMGGALWKRGCQHLIEGLLPPGGMRDLAMNELPGTFDMLDESTGVNGVIQCHHVHFLLKKVAHPGLTVDELYDFIKSELQMEIPLGDLQQCFNIMDINGDGVLSWQEFIPAMKYLLTSFIPHVILERMGLSNLQIFLVVVAIALNLGAVYLFITLVFAAFTTGEGVASAMHSAMSAGVGAYQHLKSQASDSGVVQGVESVVTGLLNTVKESIIISLGLSKVVADRLLQEVGIQVG